MNTVLCVLPEILVNLEFHEIKPLFFLSKKWYGWMNDSALWARVINLAFALIYTHQHDVEPYHYRVLYEELYYTEREKREAALGRLVVSMDKYTQSRIHRSVYQYNVRLNSSNLPGFPYPLKTLYCRGKMEYMTRMNEYFESSFGVNLYRVLYTWYTQHFNTYQTEEEETTYLLANHYTLLEDIMWKSKTKENRVFANIAFLENIMSGNELRNARYWVECFTSDLEFIFQQ